MKNENTTDEASSSIRSNLLILIVTIFLYFISIFPVAFATSKLGLDNNHTVASILKIVYFPILWAMDNFIVFADFMMSFFNMIV